MMLGQAGIGNKRNQRLETLEDKLSKMHKKDTKKFKHLFESTDSREAMGQAGFDFADSLFQSRISGAPESLKQPITSPPSPSRPTNPSIETR